MAVSWRASRVMGVAVLSAVLAAAACTGPSDNPTAGGPSATEAGGTTPVNTPSPTPTPTPSPTPPGPEGKLLWSFEADEDSEATGLVGAGKGFVLLTDTRLHGLNAKGKEVWHVDREGYQPGESDNFAVRVSGDVVVISYDHPTDDRWPQPDVVKAVDADTGKTLWKDTKSSFQTVYAKTVYTTECNGEQDGRKDNCHLSARDIRTGEPRWIAPTEASAQVKFGIDVPAHEAPPDPDYLQLNTFPHGMEDETTRTLDPEKAWYLKAVIPGRGSHQSATDTLVRSGPHDEQPENGCTATMKGVNVHTGKEAWRQEWQIPEEDVDGDTERRCDYLDGRVGWGDLHAVRVKHERPMLIDLRTGKTHWTGKQPGKTVAVAKDLVVTQDDSGVIRATNHRTGRQVWTVDGKDWRSFSAEIRKGQLVLYHPYNYCDDPVTCATRVLRLADGQQLYTTPPGVIGLGDNWVATEEPVHGNSQRADYRVYAR